MEVDGRLEGLQAYAIHGTRYYRAFFSHLDDPDEIRQCQLPFDAIDAELKPGDPIRITYLRETVREIRRPTEQ
jgi:hypothetical protein